MELSTAEVNYISAIYKLSEDGGRVSTNALANEFSIAPASVTDMVQKLAEKQLVEYIPYKGVSLSKEGLPIAKQFNANHLLWKEFLTDKLGIEADKTAQLMNEFQEVRSEIVLNRLKSFLQQERDVTTIVKEVEVPVEVIVEKEIIKEVPVEVVVEKEVVKEIEVAPKEKTQPTLFDSVVNKENRTVKEQSIEKSQHFSPTLNEVKIGKKATILGIKHLEQDLREIILHYNIKIGQEVKICTQYDFDNSFLVEIEGVGIIISKRIAEQIFVQ